MTAQTKLLNAKTITHHFLKHLQPLNQYSALSAFVSPGPVEAAAVKKHAYLAVECCSGQRAGNRENSSIPANKFAILYREPPRQQDKIKLGKETRGRMW